MKTMLQQIRKERGYKSAKAFAERIGIPVPTYTNYEQGTREIGLQTACELADALECTLDELAGRSPIERGGSYWQLSAKDRAKVDEFADFLAFQAAQKTEQVQVGEIA